MSEQHRRKRARLSEDDPPDPAITRMQRAAFLTSMVKGVSPPPSTRRTPDVVPNSSRTKYNRHKSVEDTRTDVMASNHTVLPSPFTLTKIRDSQAFTNIDSISLHDILGSPLIKEAWIFNFCFDINWMMQFFDPDVRSLVRVKVIHGSWRQEDSNRLSIEDACRRWDNVENFRAYLPDQFGTHHSKMFVLFSHDDTAEVIIHTANMLMKDWTNMTQAVWRSGPLQMRQDMKSEKVGRVGSGAKLKHDLLAYLKEYKKSTQDLHKQLQEYDFSSVRGALIASVPSKINSLITNSQGQFWGYPLLHQTLSCIGKTTQPVQHDQTAHRQPHIVAQVSSIATLPNKWLDNLLGLVSTSSSAPDPALSIVYPTPTNVAQSLDGYAAGGSIHTKAQSPAHLSQINSLRPCLNQWTRGPLEGYRAGRDRAAPHIKTYIQFNQTPTQQALEDGDVEIQWALLTSANLSVQAWGSLPRQGGKDKGTVHIQSFEIGVMVWPELFEEGFDEIEQETSGQNSEDARKEKAKVKIVPVFGTDTPGPDTMRTHQRPDGRNRNEDREEEHSRADYRDTIIVGLRMPYDLPLTPYKSGEMPWSPSGTYMELDSHGGVWDGGGGR